MKKSKSKKKQRSGKGRGEFPGKTKKEKEAVRKRGAVKLEVKSSFMPFQHRRAEEEAEGELEGEERRWDEKNPQDDEPGEAP